MPLFPPVTDTLRWDDLVREGRSLLPLVAADWTDQNTSDPGIALLELIAWLAETDSYRSGVVSDRERRLLLALAGFAPAAPRAARCLVQVTAAAPGPVAAGREFDGDRDGDVIPFTLLHDVAVSGATVAAVAWTAAGGAAGDRATCVDLTRARAAGRPIEPFGADPTVGDTLLVGLARAGGLVAGDVDLWFVADDGLTAPERTAPPPLGSAPAPADAHHTARTAWEAWDGAQWTAVTADDRTAALSQSGRVRLSWPAPVAAPIDPRPPSDAEAGPLAGIVAHWVRCRIVTAGHDAPPRLSGLHLDAGEAVAARTYTGADAEEMGVARGVPHERMRLARSWCDVPPTVTADGRPVRIVTDLALAGARDLCAVLEPDGVTLRFGDGRAGDLLPAGAEVRATGWWTTTAGLGDVRPPVAIAATADAAAGFRLVAGLRAGAPAEDVAATAARAEAALWVHDRLTDAVRRRSGDSLDALPLRDARALGVPERAVTARDAERIALATPGVALARARALPQVDPRLPGLVADGCLTVVVVPWLPVARPFPAAGALRRVRANLEAGRTLGTRIFVVGPEYASIAVTATLVLRPGARADTTVIAAEEAMRAFLHPVPTGAETGGWPFGRTVRRTEVLQRLDALAGVDRVDDLTLAREGCPPGCDDLDLCPTELALAGPLTFTTRVTARPTTRGGAS